MVNKTQFHKTKIAMAVVVSLGLAACGDDGSVTTGAENTITQAQQQTGTVQGVVVDTNGNPIEGAAVFLGAAETVTNAGGQYIFSDVAVTNVSGVNNEGNENDDSITQSLVITIVGTDEYLGALVTVTPESQVNNTGGQGEDQNGGNSDVTAQTFVDGFTAEADIAVLPMLNAGAYGYIRHCETGQPFLNAADLLSLDFVTINADADDDIDDDQITNAEDNHAISSDENGMFSLTNLAANSSYTITPKKGWTITSGSTSVSTGSEDSSEFLGTIEVCPVEFVEADVTVAPWIKAIDGQIGNSTITDNSIDYAALNQGVVNDFVIWFSEEMASTFDLTEARVKVIAPGETLSVTVADATVTLAADGKSATVTFVTDLAEGSKVDVWFPHWTALDANDDLFLVDNNAIDWDEVAVTTATKAVYTHAFFCTFNKPDDAASVILGPQIFDADTTEDANSTDLAEYSTAFQDNWVNTASDVVSQLNDGDATTESRLNDLADARLAPATVTIVQDYAVVSYDSTNAASIVWTLNDVVVVPTLVPLAGNFVTYTDPLGVTTLHVNLAAHGDVITATPVNGFGDVLTDSTMSVTLVDAIAPTTVLQESYNITDSTIGPRADLDLVDGTTANASFGNGGEISAPGTTATAAGEPIIHIQPRHLDGAGDRNEELNALTAGMSGRLTDAEITALGGAALAQTRMSESVIATTAAGNADHTMPIYDATAIADWAAVPATIGAAFSEDVTLTTTAPVFSGSTTINGFAALNDVAADVDGNVVSVDLVTFDTPDVVALSLDAGADLGFVGSVTDSRDNVSTANAQVFIQDTFPPMITETVWNGVTLELTFNEPVTIPDAGTTIRVIDPQTTTNVVAIPVAPANAAVAGNVLSITLTGAENTAIAPLFVDGANTEFLYNDNGNALNEQQHALIDWDNIEDATGNSWSEFSPSLSTSNRGLEAAPVANDVMRWEVVAPRFLAVNEVGAFTYSVATAGYSDLNAGIVGDDDGTVTYTLTFTHPINLTTSNAFSDVIALHPSYALPIVGAVVESTATADGTTLINGLFTADIDGPGAQATLFAVNTTTADVNNIHGALNISADHKVLTLTATATPVTGTTIVFGVTEFGLAKATTSSITGTQTSAGNFVWQNNN